MDFVTFHGLGFVFFLKKFSSVKPEIYFKTTFFILEIFEFFFLFCSIVSNSQSLPRQWLAKGHPSGFVAKAGLEVMAPVF